MKRKIILSLLAVFVLFTAGAVIAMLYMTQTTAALSRLIELHQIERIRQDLVINLQIVQSDLYTAHTPRGERLDAIVNNVTTFENAANRCSSCHHSPELSMRIGEMQGYADKYKNALNYYITASADSKRIEKLKADAAAIGNKLIMLTQEMTFTASQRLQKMTSAVLIEMNRAKVILFVTLTLASLIALLVSGYLIRQVTRPVSELVNATRMIASGNLGHTISYDDKTEFGELARNFNAMSMALKEGYEKITESEWKFRTLSEFAYDWEYWINEKKEIIFMSPSCKQITGYSQEEFINNPHLICDIIHAEERNICKEHMDNFSAPQHEEIEFRIITKNGQIKWLSHVCGPIYIGDRFLGRRVSNRDITDRKRLEEQLMQSQKMESLGLLAGGIAHDFNNLLTAISGYTSMLQQELGDSDEKTRRYIQHVMNASDRAQKLTSSLLAFSRKQIMKPSIISLTDVMKNISGLMKRLIGEDIELIVTYPDTEFSVFADPHHIEQALMNLITNARDAMPSGGRLAIGASPAILEAEFTQKYGAKPGKYMMLSISDTGSGIGSRDMPHIFEPFFTTKDKDKGTGLGLSMIYGIIKQHGGFIDVYSEIGWGTTFKIYLPASDESRGNIDETSETAMPEIDFSGNETIF
ncbi:MAG: PAS domain S-box protein, partial [Nitrospirae bacterium]|nr:PAS domain S-box protein [Nitrospirota bacterium]